MRSASLRDCCLSGKKLAAEGRHEEALEEYARCLNCGFGHVSNISLLQAIGDLAKEYPPALEVLKERQLALESRIVAGDAEDDELPEYVALNDALGDQEKSVAIYRKMIESHASAKSRQRLWFWIFDYLFDAGRFQEVAQEAGTSLACLAAPEALVSVMAHVRHPDRPIPRVLRLGLAQYRSLLEVGEQSEARKVADAILALDARVATFAMLVREARAADELAEVERLSNAAREKRDEATR